MNKSDASDDQPDERANHPPASDVQTRFAWLRTRMALQTTLAAWVRTATSLIGFGFVIVQFLEHTGLVVMGGNAKSVHLARVIGLVLIGAGSLTTAIAMWEYRIAVKYLEGGGFRDVAGIPTVRKELPDVAVWMAVLVCLIGILAFALILVTTELH
jgi:putative membrane protein